MIVIPCYDKAKIIFLATTTSIDESPYMLELATNNTTFNN